MSGSWLKMGEEKNIRTSYGQQAVINNTLTGCFYGAGYGKNSRVSKAVDRIAVMLYRQYPLELEKRCNSNGLSGGAFHDTVPYLKLGVRLCKDGSLKYDAGFESPKIEELTDDENEAKLKTEIKDAHSIFCPDGELTINVYSKYFKTPKQALNWLTRFGEKYNPKQNNNGSNAK